MSTVNQEPSALVALVVDDDPSMRRLCRLVLEREGFRVAEARSGAEGMATSRAVQPDLILIDVVLPGLDGLTVTQRLRSDAAMDTVPILMMSGLSESEAVHSAFERGADAFIIKPFTHQELASRVRGLCRLRRMLKSLQRSNDHLGRQAHVLTVLLDYFTYAAQCRERSAFLNQSVCVAATIVGCRRGALWLTDKADRSLHVAASIGADGSDLLEELMQADDGLHGEAFAKGETIIIGPDEVADKCSESEIRWAKGGVLAAPLSARGVTDGVLLLTDPIGRHSFEYEDARYVELLATFAASVVELFVDDQAPAETCSCEAASR